MSINTYNVKLNVLANDELKVGKLVDFNVNGTDITNAINEAVFQLTDLFLNERDFQIDEQNDEYALFTFDDCKKGLMVQYSVELI